MKPIMTHVLVKRTAKATGMMLVLGGVHILPLQMSAQQPEPIQGNPNAPMEFPGGRGPLPAVRGRPVRMAPAENTPAMSRERISTGRMSSGQPSSGLLPPVEVTPARFEATVYEIEVPEARMAEIEAPALEAKAATPQELAKALGEFGKTKILYRIDQAVNLCSEHITLSTREPMVTGARRTDGGPSINTVTYQEVGLVVNLATSPSPPDMPRRDVPVQVNFELSTLADSGVEIAPTVKASRVRSLQLSHSETPRFGKPLVLLNVSAPPGGDKSLPVAYVVRYVFREVKP